MMTTYERLQLLLSKANSYRRIIFWEHCPIDEITVITGLAQVHHFETLELIPEHVFTMKYLIEVQKRQQNLLIYTKKQLEPEQKRVFQSFLASAEIFYDDDWATFAKSHELEYVQVLAFKQQYHRFFQNKKRIQSYFQRVKQMPDFALNPLVLALVICQCECDPVAIWQKLLADPTTIVELAKFAVLHDVQAYLQNEFGVSLGGSDWLDQLLTALVVSGYQRDSHQELTGVPQTSKPNQIAVILENLRLQPNWEVLIAEKVAEFTDIFAFATCSTEQLLLFQTYPEVDELLQDRFLNFIEENTQLASIELRIQQRLQNPLVQVRSDLAQRYHHLLAAAALQKQLVQITDIDLSDPELYLNQTYRIDTAYRLLQVDSHQMDERLQQLTNRLKTCYERDWLEKLSTEVTMQSDLPLAPQTTFFATYVEPYVKGKRQVIIISDAFRYEAGKELTQRLRRSGIACDCQALAGSVPTYTQLGMASLLPQLGPLTLDNKVVKINGLSTQGLKNREKVLQMTGVESAAMEANDFRSLLVSQRKAWMQGKKVLYLYHNHIDAIADKAATEHQTFAATETAIDELIQLIKMVQQAGTERILLTADHGYLYVSQAMKTEKVEWLGLESREQNSRFKLFEATTPLEYQYGTTMIQTPETPLTNVTAVMPTALRRFSAGKGAHFFHGGCSLQERIVPVVMIDSKNDTTQLTIEIDSNNKVTQYQPKIRFYQRSLLGEKAPLVTRMYFQRDGKPISNIVYHDFQATKKAELTQVISFSLFEQAYPIGSQFVLVVEIPTLQNTWQPYITKTYESFIQIQEK